MFKEYVRADEYLITALLYLPKDMDVKTISFKPSDSTVVGLDGLDEAGYRIFCVMLNRELNAELTNALSCKHARELHCSQHNYLPCSQGRTDSERQVHSR